MCLAPNSLPKRDDALTHSFKPKPKRSKTRVEVGSDQVLELGRVLELGQAQGLACSALALEAHSMYDVSWRHVCKTWKPCQEPGRVSLTQGKRCILITCSLELP